MGLAELVADFEKSGGSLGTSRTRWPKSEKEWADLQENDEFWGPIILKLKTERKVLLEKLPARPTNMTKEEVIHYENEQLKVRTYGKEKGRVLVYDGVLRVQPLDQT